VQVFKESEGIMALLNLPHEALHAARLATPGVTHLYDEVTVHDQGDHWLFEFVSRQDILGGGAHVSIAKDGFRVLNVLRHQ
jgi:hypothetical protein